MSPNTRYRRYWCIGLGLAMLCNAGCNPLTAIYFLFLLPPPKIEAAYEGLDKQKVVVIAHVSRAAEFVHPGLEVDLVKGIVRELRENGDDVELVDISEVRQWKDEHVDYELVDVGKAFSATRVLYIEVQSFSLYEHQSSTLYRGSTKIRVQVADIEKDGDIVFDTHVEPMFPGSRPLPTSEMSSDKFRMIFVRYLARQIAHHFFEYRPDEDFTVN